MKFFSYILFFIFSFSHLSFSKENYQTSYRINKNKISQGSSFVLSFSIYYEDKIPKFEIMNLDQWVNSFDLIGKWSERKSSINIINGKMESEKIISYHYRIKAKKKGKFSLSPLKFQVGDREAKTRAFLIEVTDPKDIEGEDLDKNQDPFSNFNLINPFRNLPNQLMKDAFSDKIFEKHFSDPWQDTSPSVDVKLHLSKKILYLRQTLRVDWIAYVNGGGVELQDKKRPELKGFWKENLLENSQPRSLGREIKNGVPHEKTLIASYALFPLQVGELEIDPYEFRTISLGFFSNPRMEKNHRTEMRKVKILSLPKEGKINFSGGVGDFRVKAWLNENKTEVNRPIIFHLRFEGKGHPQFIQIPKIPFPDFLKTYDPSSKSFFSIHSNKNYKEFEILVSSQKKGTIIVPEFTFTTFDPEKATYVVHKISSLKFEVFSSKIDGEIDGEKFFDTAEGKNDEYINQIPWHRSLFSFHHKSLFLFYFILHSFFITFFIFIYLKYFRNEKKELSHLIVEKKLKHIPPLIQAKKYQEAAIQLKSIISFALSQIVEIESAEGKKLIANLPPSLYKNFSLSLNRLIDELESISFSGKRSSEGTGQKMEYLLKQSETILIQIFQSYKEFFSVKK